jgi:group II intron reverse transcriptase/maturase
MKRMDTAKPFDISKQQVWNAYKAVRANAGAAGVDKETIADFEVNLKGNLYKIWNRLSSGSYFPPPVKAVAIPKKNGGERILGVPTVADRVAQTVVKQVLEPILEPCFSPDSYGYRPGKSALDAIAVTRERCWRYDWVLEFDIKGLFDNIDHALLLKALEKHTTCAWAILYVKRWLTAPLQLKDGTKVERDRGTPQGGVVSPLLANLFLNYAFDVWLSRAFPELPWCRYADDGLVHCRTEEEALAVKAALQERFAACGLEMHPDKTRIVYCKDANRPGSYPTTKFDFLGYEFRPRGAKARVTNILFTSFSPGVSAKSLKAMRARTRKLNFRNQTHLGLEELARYFNPVLRGWIAYYGRFHPSAMWPIYRHADFTIRAWIMRKYKRLYKRKVAASLLLRRIAEQSPTLFAHWRFGGIGAFV